MMLVQFRCGENNLKNQLFGDSTTVKMKMRFKAHCGTKAKYMN